MPGRVSVRQARAARASASSDMTTAAPSRKSSTQTLNTTSKRATSTRTSAPSVAIPDEGPSTPLRALITGIFADAQKSNAAQRKLVVTLRKLHEECCYELPAGKKRLLREEAGEEDFNAEVGRVVLRVVGVRKSEGVGERVVRFLGSFLKWAGEKDTALLQGDDADATDGFLETPASRLTTHVLTLLIPLMTVKDKLVRFRSTQIIAHIVNSLDSIDDEVFQVVRHGLLKRLRDKESQVRVQAVLGLGRLAGESSSDDDDSDSDDDSGGVLMKLLDILQNDPSAEVRRALLLNLPFTPATLPYLLERARDLDGATRRALYSRLLPALGDFRHLSLTHREKLLRWGLRDRDENVRKATARLFRERWIEDCATTQQAAVEAADGDEAPAPPTEPTPSIAALTELLERIDVVNSGVETGIAFEAMREFWDGRPDYRDLVEFADPFWNPGNLNPEAVFVARTFNEYCRTAGSTQLEGVVEERMPEVTKFAFLLQKHIEVLVEGVRLVANAADGEEGDAEEDTVQQEFCVEQMLHIALTLDYSDEVGRRKMFSVMRESLACPDLPEESTKLVIEALRTVCGQNSAGEREFCGIVLEAVAEVHDAIMGDESDKGEDDSFHSARSELSDDTVMAEEKAAKKKKKQDATPGSEDEEKDEERAIREIMVNMKCLHIAQCMLQNVQCDLEENSVLVTMLNSLVIPAVRSQEAPIRERGLLCLGLCCLLSKNLAQENLTLFLHCFAKGNEAIQKVALEIITDILTTHPSLLLPSPTPLDASTASQPTSQPNALLKPLLKLYTRPLSHPSAPHLTAAAALAASKLMLLSVLREPELLRSLLLAYLDPDTRGNASLRQSLSYFLPVFCHTRRENAVMMARIAVGVLRAVAEEREEEDEDEDEEYGRRDDRVGLVAIGGMVVEWTDPRKLHDFGIEKSATAASSTAEVEDADEDPHVVLALELLERLCMGTSAAGVSKEEKKAIVSMLGKLHIVAPAQPSQRKIEKLQEVFDLSAEALETRGVAGEVGSRNVLGKLQAGLTKEGGVDTAVVVVAPVGAATDVDVDGSVTTPADEEGDGEQTVNDESMAMTEMGDVEMTQLPDAEGTVMPLGFGDDEEEDEDEETTVGDLMPGARRARASVRRSAVAAVAEDSVLDSLLEGGDEDEDEGEDEGSDATI
ncbi:ARM repeat-containing protein [Aulographum hederae CBS 113979]|uniref:ARM repeat-containing protein n=1 Tax=Aulographum hederae CBS 113979 TaxID=1176131 RepID=A0A6G1GLN1_9PEZI|nr:ARM repeat-containing protein [Aulographum hederae CBS 113979]